ncbi:MAG TPA: histidine ammonia-lyase [Methanosarcinales archaeon]|nr:histidine ammonia-lyase [Methanosarcinales archaeon]
MKHVLITGLDINILDVISVSRDFAEVELSTECKEKVIESANLVQCMVEEGRVVYGVTTGFGDFSNVVIPRESVRTLQKNLLMSHATGVGNLFEKEIVRAIMLLRINSLASGYSGIRLETLELLVQMLNKKVHPCIPEKGSVGASGDLAPLAHLSLVLIGFGEAEYKGQILKGREALEKAGLTPVTLEAKEGLALINGTQVMTAIAALVVYDFEILLKVADIAASMSLEALRGTDVAFDPRIHKLRPYKGQRECANNILKLMQNSDIRKSHLKCPKVQDAYSLRCVPQVHGASRDTLDYVKNIINIELNSVTDNPIIFTDTKKVLSGGNFHGQPIALAMDYIGIAISEIADISERRIERLVNAKLSDLPGFLVEKGGLESGFMITQYSAAALVSENKVLAHPASVDSIPTSANQEDHVSMGTISARKAREILFNTQNVIAIEILCASQGLDFLHNKAGVGTQEAYKTVRSKIPHLEEDRILFKDIITVRDMLKEILEKVEKKVGALE